MLTEAFINQNAPREILFLASQLTNWAVLLVANLVFSDVTNAVFASELGCGVVTESAASLHPSSTGDRADVPW